MPAAAGAGPGSGVATTTADTATQSVSAGLATPEFTEVRELFDSFLSDDPGYSAQLCVYRRGTKVVDLGVVRVSRLATSRAPIPVPRGSPRS
jgi:hypothetical protein